jgi:predicted N-formylglutamate amidohydrolase
VIAGDAGCGILILADHASNHVPAEFQALGLPAAELVRHIAYDIGVTRHLCRLLDAPGVMSRFSRLLIDPNRGKDDPTLVMRIADGALVPGNARIGADEVEARRRRFHAPYHMAIAEVLDAMMEQGPAVCILSVHSFTPVMKGIARPWHAGVMWDADPRLAQPLLQALSAEVGLVIGDNEPYDGALAGDTIDQHATARGLPNALVEIRQDLIADEAGAQFWAEKLLRLLNPILALPDIREVAHYPSRTRSRIRPS